MIDLSTNYLGLKLQKSDRSLGLPADREAGELSRMEEAGASAIVMYSLFEEQIEAESENIDTALEYGANSYAESTSYLPDMPKYHIGPDRYLELLHKGKNVGRYPGHRQPERQLAAADGFATRSTWNRPAPTRSSSTSSIFPLIRTSRRKQLRDALLRAGARHSQERADSDRGEGRPIFHFVCELRQEAVAKRARTASSSSIVSINPTSTWRSWRSHRTWC